MNNCLLSYVFPIIRSTFFIEIMKVLFEEIINENQ